MGLHEVCRNPYHHFDREKEVYAERIERNGEQDVLYQGFCKECGYLRIIYHSELKEIRK